MEEGPHDDLITVEQCNQFWDTIKEKILSSKSNKHVGTYKAAKKIAPTPLSKHDL